MVAVVSGGAHFLLALPALISQQYMEKMGQAIYALFLTVFFSISTSYAATLLACVGTWWEQAKKSDSKWTMFFSFLFLSDSVHYMVFCSIFIIHGSELLRLPVYFPPFVYALLNVLPVLINNTPMPDAMKQNLQNVTAQQDHIYQLAVQIEAALPLLFIVLFSLKRSPPLLMTALIYTLVFLRIRFMTNYATHSLFSSVSNSIRATLSRIPILLKVYEFVVGLISRGQPDGVITPSMLMEAIQHPQHND